MDERPWGGENHKWWVLATIDIGILMATIDASIVNIALPTILTDLDTQLIYAEWVLVAYLLAITALLLPFGRLADMVGRKKVYSAGFGVFVVGSGLCGLSQSVEELIIFRVLQAVGAAMVLANGFAIVTAVFPARQRGMALGINGTVVAAGFTLGPTIGGLLIDSLGWRWIFYVNLPIGILGTVAAVAILDEALIMNGTRRGSQRFDLAGALLSTAALVSLVLALNLGPESGWLSDLVLLLGGLFVLSMAAFFLVESRLREPLVDLRLFHRRTFMAGNLAGLLAFLGISANAFLMPFFLQVVLGYSAIAAGLLMTPTALIMSIVAPVSGWMSDRIGARVLSSLGLAVSCAALLLMSSLDVRSTYITVLGWLLLLGVGQGLFQAPNNSSVMGDVPRERLGIGSGILSMVRNVGQVVGTAIGAAFLLSGLSAATGTASLGNLEVGQVATPTEAAAFLDGMHTAYIAAAAFVAIGIAASLVRGGRAAPPAEAEERRAA